MATNKTCWTLEPDDERRVDVTRREYGLFSRLLALSVIGSCVDVKDHVPDMKQLKEISLVVFDPLTKKYEERVTCI